VELSADVDAFRLWFRLPRRAEELRAEPWIAATLIPAMVVGDRLRIEDALPVSPKFLRAMETMQAVVNAWNPRFRRIEIETQTVAPACCASGVGAFYSGGVDSSFTVLRRLDEIEFLILINGFDFQSDASTFARVVERNRRYCDRLGKELLVAETNYYDFGRRYRVTRAASCGGLLASVASGLGLRQVHIASSYDYLDLPAYGSHPLLDPLWSTEAAEFIHDDAEVCRTSKLEFVAQHAEALENLHVCWRDPVENCGDCSKCLRTMICLRLLGYDESRLFPRQLTMDNIARFPIDSASARGFAADNLQLAIRVGDRPIAAALRKCLWKYDARRLAVDMDRVLLGGRVKKLRNRLQPLAAEDAPDLWPSAKGH
jgi:hypothetical protein